MLGHKVREGHRRSRQTTERIRQNDSRLDRKSARVTKPRIAQATKKLALHKYKRMHACTTQRNLKQPPAEVRVLMPGLNSFTLTPLVKAGVPSPPPPAHVIHTLPAPLVSVSPVPVFSVPVAALAIR